MSDLCDSRLALAALEAGHITHAEAARKLRVRRATLDAALRVVRKGGATQAWRGRYRATGMSGGSQRESFRTAWRRLLGQRNPARDRI